MCDRCGARATNLIFTTMTDQSSDAMIDAPFRIYVYPICNEEKWTAVFCNVN